MYHLTRTLAIVACVVAALLGVGTIVARAQTVPSSAGRGAGNPAARSATVPQATLTAPPLPFGDLLHPASSARSAAPTRRVVDASAMLARLPASQRHASVFVPYSGPRPPIPKLSDLLHHHTRGILSASGASIVLSGPLGVSYLEDATVAYGSSVGWICQNLTPSTQYEYVVFSPDGYAAQVEPYQSTSGTNIATFKTDASGRCLDTSQFPYYAGMPLVTPLVNGGGGTVSDPIIAIGPTRGGAADPPYSGVWAIAVKNVTTGQFEAVAYTVVLGTLNFNTYSDAGFTTRAADFTSGSTVYVSASGLNPSHFYAFGFVNTSGNGLPCLYTIPSNAQNNPNATCFLVGTTGVLPTSGTFSGQYTTPAAGVNSVGTYSVQLFDSTTFDLISTQQISLNPASVVWSALVPYNGVTNGANNGDTFAVDGILNSNTGAAVVTEDSVQGLTYAATGLVAGHVYRITVSNPNGVVMGSTTSDTYSQSFSTPATYTANGGGALPATKVAFPVNTATITSFGPAQTSFAPNVYTAQLYDTTAGTVAGSKSFTLLSYAAQLRWTNPGGTFVNANTTATTVTTTLQNTAGVDYGPWNADGVGAITITSDSSNFVSLGLQAGITTTTDSSGHIWTITNPNIHTLVVTPPGGISLPANGTIPIPMTVADPGSKCGGGCTLRTSFMPAHGIVASQTNATMQNTASNGLLVFLAGSGGTVPTYSLAVGPYSAAQLGTPRYPQMMYRTGTNGASGGTYRLTFTLNNSGAAKKLESAEFALPPTFDAQLTPPTLVSVFVNGINKTANWTIQAPSPFTGTIGVGCDPAVNDFGVTTAVNAATVPIGGSAVVTISLPILPTTFAFQELTGTGNYCDSASLGAARFQLGQTNVLTNSIAGTTNVDSTELAVFGFDTALMTATLTPSTITGLAGSTFTYAFINSSTGEDANPDYVSQLLITIPAAGAGIYPVVQSVVASNGATYNANATGTAGQWLIDLCAVNTAPVVATQASTPCAAATDASSLPPSGSLNVTFKYAVAPTVGSYPINWTAVGANGGAVVAATGSQVPTLVIANTTAQTSFKFAGGYTAAPSYPPALPILPVPGGSQPIVGSWSDNTNGNGFVYELHNNGSTVISDISIALPASNTSGQIFDSANDWSVIASSVHTYGGGATGAQCSNNGYKTLTQPIAGSPGTPGILMLSGCTVAVGQTIDVFFYAKSPYDINSTFSFPASVALGGTPANPSTSPNTLPLYAKSNTILIGTDARLAITLPVGGTYGATLFGSPSPVVNCAACTYTVGAATPLIDLNTFTGTKTATDVMAASVYSDDSNGWSLSVAADVNPPTATGQVSTWMIPSHSTAAGGFAIAVPGAPGGRRAGDAGRADDPLDVQRCGAPPSDRQLDDLSGERRTERCGRPADDHRHPHLHVDRELMMRNLGVVLATFILGVVPAVAGAGQGSVQMKYKVTPYVRAQVVPNYQSSFGPQGGTGSGATPAPGASAVLNGGTVDFGNVIVGYEYLYKYAAQLSVQTNDSAGFIVYAEGATDLNGSNPVPAPATYPIFSTLYWLPSSAGNTPFSPATSFNKTGGNPILGGAGGIDYSGTGGVPSAMSTVWSSPLAGNVSRGFDYQLRLSGTIPTSQFNVYIVYTVIGN